MLVAVSSPSSSTTATQHDSRNPLVGVIENDTGGLPTNDSNVLTQYVYNAIGSRLVITNALGYTATLTVYDALNRPIVVEDALGNQTITQYNALGYRTVMTDANDAVTTFSYDGLNRLVETNYLADAKTVSYSYDALGNRLAMSDALGISSYAYDDLSRLITVTSPLAGTVVYGYDDVGNRTSLRYPDTKQVTYTYDGDNRLIMVEDWAEGMTEYEYDAAGRLITTTLPNGVITTNQYDDANRLIGLSHHDGNGRVLSAYEYELDGVGNRIVVTETLRLPVPETVVLQPGPEVGIDTDIDRSYPNSSYGGASTARIGTRGGPGSSYPGGPYRSLLQFDLSAIPVGAAVESATLEVYAYQYEGTNTFRLYRATSAWDESATWNTQPSYDASTLWGSFSTSTYRQYVKRATDVSAIATQWVDGVYPNYGFYIKGANESPWTRHWFYTSDGADLSMRPKLIVTLSDTLDTTTIRYSYDPLYRLTEASYAGNVVADFNYEYDAVGNMTAYIEADEGSGQETGVTRVFNAANQLISSYDGATTTTYGYDDNGNLLTITTPMGLGGVQGQGYAYNQRNLLITHSTIGPANQVRAAFVYDGNANRVQQIDYNGGQPVTITYTNDILGMTQVLLADDGTTTTANLFGLDLISQDDGTQTRFLLTDGLGSVRQELAGGDLQTTTTYEPYGNLLTQTGTSGTVYGFTGEQEDAATGLVYLRARYYNPYIDHFLSRDPYPGSTKSPASQNGYNYANNNPMRFIDPTGLCGADIANFLTQECINLRSILQSQYDVEINGPWKYWEMQTLSLAFEDLDTGLPFGIEMTRFILNQLTIKRVSNLGAASAVTDISNKLLSIGDEAFGHGQDSARFVILHEFGHVFEGRAPGANQLYKKEPKNLFSEYEKQEWGDSERWGEAFAATFFNGSWSNLIGSDPLVFTRPDASTINKTKLVVCTSVALFSWVVYPPQPSLPIPIFSLN